MNNKALAKILVYLMILAFFVIYQAYFSQFTQITFAATLNPGQTYFYTASMAFENLQFSGNFDYLRIYWDTNYVGVGSSQIGVKCYLNCNPALFNCDGFQNCTYVGPQGSGVCTIQPVVYNQPLDFDNIVVCIFYNPSYPQIEYKKSGYPYVAAAFKPIDFELFISQNFTVTVGQQFNMPINIKNTGLFTDSYNINVTAYPENLIDLDPVSANATIGPLTGQSFGNVPETFASISKMRVLSTESPINIFVNASSVINNTISHKQIVQIRAGVSSLPDFGLFGLIQIILLAAVILFLKL